jgi:PAS domain S-box-containing protein
MTLQAEAPATVDLERLARAMTAGQFVSWELDMRTDAVWLHPRDTSLFGFDAEHFSHLADFAARLHPDDVEALTEARRRHLSGEGSVFRADFRFLADAGDHRWLEVVGCVSHRDAEGQPLILTGFVLDISARKRVELELREEEERLRSLFHGHSAAKLVIDPSTGAIVDANESAATFYGWPIATLCRMRIQEINTLGSEEIGSAMASAMTSQNTRFDFRHRKADGTVCDVEVFSNRVVVGSRTLLYSIVHDISDRKRAENALLKHERNLVRAEDFARFGHWQLSLDDGVIRASAGAGKVYGFDSLELPYQVVKDRVLVEDRPRLDAAMKALIERGEPYHHEFRIRRASDGQVVVVQSIAEYDAASRTVFGVVQDVTARKKIEDEREALILQLQSAIEHIRTLKGILPICASCKKVRDDQGYWEQVEAYVSRHTDVQFSHGICPECIKKHYPDI